MMFSLFWCILIWRFSDKGGREGKVYYFDRGFLFGYISK